MPSVYDYTIEYGRWYQNFKNGYYPISNDDEELNREDIMYTILMELYDE